MPGRVGAVPLVDVTHDPSLSDGDLRRLAACLPDLVGRAADCPEEPWTGRADAGDIEIRFHRKSELDVGKLGLVVEVRMTLLGSRLDDRQRRVDLIRDHLASLGLGPVGVWLIFAEGVWSQSAPLP
jgi:hypothetical protein